MLFNMYLPTLTCNDVCPYAQTHHLALSGKKYLLSHVRPIKTITCLQIEDHWKETNYCIFMTDSQTAVRAGRL